MTQSKFRCFCFYFVVLAAFCLNRSAWPQAITKPAATDAVTNAVLVALPSAPAPQNGVADGDESSSARKSQSDQAEQQLRQEEHQRILGVIPNFNTTYIQDAAPLSAKQKFHLMFRSTVDPFEFFAAGAVAGYGQATNSHSGYGQGAEGYAKRYGAAFADSTDGAFWGNAVLPSLLHQDPRYFRRGTGSFWSRFKYSVLTTVWSKSDNGTWGPNYSNVLGNVIAGGISNLYYPSADRGVGLTFEGAAIVTLEGTAGSLGVEFWPDVSHKLFHTPLPSQAAVAPK